MTPKLKSNQLGRIKLGVRAVAQGRWRQILPALGLDDHTLSGDHCACPICGGKDRFRFDNKEGRGTYFCNRCGPGDGVQLVIRLTGLSFKEAAVRIEELVGGAPIRQPQRERLPEDKFSTLASIYRQSGPIQREDDVYRYLIGRGLTLNRLPEAIRLHQNLHYFDASGSRVGSYPAMLGIVSGPDGSALSMHRTYLQDGKKAPVVQPKKIMQGHPISGGAIRLARTARRLGIAEGIETALAASELFGVPCWSCLSAAGIASFVPPPDVEELIIFADNDPSFVGQSAAWKAAERLTRLGLRVTVRIPPDRGDWLDVLTRRSAEQTIGQEQVFKRERSDRVNVQCLHPIKARRRDAELIR